MAAPILNITDGTITVNLLENINGFGLREWLPAIAGVRDGGVYSVNAMADGRRLTFAAFENVTETFSLTLHSNSQDTAIENSQKLRRLLQKARDYWTTDWQREPVWITVRAPNETNTRYAIIHNWQTPQDANPFSLPFFNCGDIVMNEFELVVERGHWMGNQPGQNTCVIINSLNPYVEAGAQSGVGEQSITAYTLEEGDWESGCFDDNSTFCSPEYCTSMEWEADYLMGGNSINVGIGTYFAGVFDQRHYRFALRFRNVVIPQHAYITSAYVALISSGGVDTNAPDFPFDAEIYTQAIGNARPVYTHEDLSIIELGTPSTPSGRSLIPPSLSENHVDWSIPSAILNTEYDTPDLSTIVQEVVDRSDWDSGNSMIVYFKSVQSSISDTCVASFYNADAGGIYVPILYVTYHILEDEAHGQEDTCTEDVVYVGNKNNRANISHVYRYDASGPSWSGNLIQGAEALPFKLFPTTPAADDILYLGISTDLANSGPFCNVVFDIGTASVKSVRFTWEYYNGSWTTLDVKDKDEPGGPPDWFFSTGIKGIFWHQPSDWTTVAVNGVTGYWVRAKITSVGVTPICPYQQNRIPYTITNAFVDIPVSSVGGDLPSLAKILVRNDSHDDVFGDTDLAARRVLIGLRSKDRGDDYSPYINLSTQTLNAQNAFGTWIGIVDTTTTSDIESLDAPIGRALRFLAPTSTDMEARFEVRFQTNAFGIYLGTFRAFLRSKVLVTVSSPSQSPSASASQSASRSASPSASISPSPSASESPSPSASVSPSASLSPSASPSASPSPSPSPAPPTSAVRARLALVFGDGDPENYTEAVWLNAVGNELCLTDMGVLTIPPTLLVGSEEAENLNVRVYLENTEDSSVDILFTELILFPVDEWALDCRFTNELTLGSWFYSSPRLRVDSLGDLKQTVRVFAVNQDEQSLALLSKIYNGPAILQANKDQRLWFLMTDTSMTTDDVCDFEVCSTVSVKKNQQYFSMRGAR